MLRSASDLIPQWCSDVWDVYVPPHYPFENRTISDREWKNWTEGGECSGLWETQDPFPERVALIWEEMMMTKAPYPYNNLTRDDRAKVLLAWERRFTSAMARIEFSDYPSFSHSIARDGKLPATDLFVGHGQIAQIQCWRGSDCRHRYHPYPCCKYTAREVIPVPPWQGNMHYWLAEIQDGHHQFRAILETTLRGDLGSRGRVDVCYSQEIMEWFLPRAAKRLPINWDKLPLVIARAKIEGLFFRANQTKA